MLSKYSNILYNRTIWIYRSIADNLINAANKYGSNYTDIGVGCVVKTSLNTSITLNLVFSLKVTAVIINTETIRNGISDEICWSSSMA